MKKSVLIIGGGVAGLAAARELVRNDVAVTVLEANDRCGGRIQTIRDGGVPVELGAEFVHGESEPLLRTIKEAKLFAPPVSEQNHLLENGKLSEVDLWKVIEDVIGRIEPDGTDCSCDEFLAASIREPERTYVRHFVQGFHAADPGRISAQALYRGEEAAKQMNGTTQLRLADGYAALVDFLERDIIQLDGVIHKKMTVQQVNWQRGSVEVLAEARSVGLVSPEPHEFDSVPPIGGKPETRIEKFAAEAAVVALPLGVLKRGDVRFDPPLVSHELAIRGMECGNVVKIMLFFDPPFWDDFGFIHSFAEPIPTWWSDPLKPMLTGWAGGPKAEALLNRSHAQMEALALEVLARIFPDKAAALPQHFKRSYYWNWADDPFIRGAYSYIPVRGLALPKLLAEPVVDTIFFAGEATVADAQTGTVFGALATGLRAARECLANGA
ncbi:MAG TPA: NAD(P)/FAD-dependent oxidoreductase [Verrucomicrobiae bacterium]